MRLALSEFQHAGEDEDRQCRAWKLFLLLTRMLLFRNARGGLLPKGQLQVLSGAMDRASYCQPRQFLSCTPVSEPPPQDASRQFGTPCRTGRGVGSCRRVATLWRGRRWHQGMIRRTQLSQTRHVVLRVCGPRCRMICCPVNRRFHSNSPTKPC